MALVALVAWADPHGKAPPPSQHSVAAVGDSEALYYHSKHEWVLPVVYGARDQSPWIARTKGDWISHHDAPSQQRCLGA